MTASRTKEQVGPAEAQRPAASTILVPIDGTPASAAALPVARAFAEAAGGVMHVLHVAPAPVAPRDLAVRLGLPADAAKGVVLDQGSGDPAEFILSAAARRDGCLIVMCARTGPAEPEHALGPVARAVVQSAACPVVLVPPDRGLRPLRLGRVLAPFDGSPDADAGVMHASELAGRVGAELLVLHVAVPDPRTEPGTYAAPRYIDQPQHEWPVWTEEFLRRSVHEPARPRTSVAMSVGDPAEAILRTARESRADLMVLCWRGVLVPHRAPIVRTVMNGAPCPVIVFRVAAQGRGATALRPRETI